MGLLDLMRLMPMKRHQRGQHRRRRQAQAQARDGLITSRAKRKGSPCQQDDDSQGADLEIHSGPSLPEELVKRRSFFSEDYNIPSLPQLPAC